MAFRGSLCVLPSRIGRARSWQEVELLVGFAIGLILVRILRATNVMETQKSDANAPIGTTLITLFATFGFGATVQKRTATLRTRFLMEFVSQPPLRLLKGYITFRHKTLFLPLILLH